jgi:hypothetical protein
LYAFHIREPKTLTTALLLLTDELLMAEETGFPCIDASRRADDHGRHFSMQVTPLFLVGDYPGLGKMVGFGHSSNSLCHCHWCMHLTPLYLAGRALFLQNRSHLPPDHWMRTTDYDTPSAPHETHPPPPCRTHAKAVAHSLESRAYDGPEDGGPWKKSGVNYYCPLVLLQDFDLVWDAAPDMMHILKNIWTKLLHIFNGQLHPAYPKKNQTVDKHGKPLHADVIAAIDRKFQQQKDKYNRLVRVYMLVCVYHGSDVYHFPNFFDET